MPQTGSRAGVASDVTRAASSHGHGESAAGRPERGDVATPLLRKLEHVLLPRSDSPHPFKGDPVGRNPLHTKLCDLLGIDFPIIAFTHCKDVVAAVVNAGGFAVLGEAMHTPDDIAADVRWIRSRVGDKPFGIDLVLPASAPDA